MDARVGTSGAIMRHPRPYLFAREGGRAAAAMLNEKRPRVGGIIEDETGWWVIVALEYDKTGTPVDVCLQGRHGETEWRSIGNLGAVTYPDPLDTPARLLVEHTPPEQIDPYADWGEAYDEETSGLAYGVESDRSVTRIPGQP